MFCTKCGAQNADDAKFCTSCGATVEAATPVAAPVAAPAPEAAPAEAKEASKIDVKAVKSQLGETLKPVTAFFKRLWTNKPLCFGIIGGVAVILVVCIVFGILDATGYKSSLNNFVDMMNGDTSKVEKVMPKEYWDYMDEEKNKDLDDIIDDFEDNLKDMQKEMKSEYGKNIKYSYTIEEATGLVVKKVNVFVDNIKTDY
jgi:uncharacterized membrane protein YvbJ